jgi:hypothetical protein
MKTRNRLAAGSSASSCNNLYKLGDGEAMHRKYPATFYMPLLDLRRNLPVGCFAKLIFEYADGNGERMWVEVVQVTETGYLWRTTGRHTGYFRS